MKKITIQFLSFVYTTGLRFFGGKGLHRIWPLGAIYDGISSALRGHAWPEFQMIDGHTIRALPSQRAALALYRGKREELEFRLFEREIPKGGTVIDVGANIGYYALPFARAVGRTGRVYAFEPEPTNVRYLRKNLEMNGYTNVDVIEKAAGDRAGSVKLFLSDFNPGGHQIWDMRGRITSLPTVTQGQSEFLADEHGDTRRAIDVPLVRLDNVFRRYKKPIHFVKIDVEGAEGGVVAGMRKLLLRHTDIKLHFEFIPALMELFGTNPKEFLSELHGFGFSFYSLLNYKKGENSLVPLTPREILARCEGNHSEELFAKRT